MKHNRYRYRVVFSNDFNRWLVIDTQEIESTVGAPFATRAGARDACDEYNIRELANSINRTSGPSSVDAPHQRNKNAPPQSDAKKAQAGW